jgi:hypothetical protein
MADYLEKKMAYITHRGQEASIHTDIAILIGVVGVLLLVGSVVLGFPPGELASSAIDLAQEVLP